MLQSEPDQDEATLRLNDVFAFLTENAADACFDPRPPGSFGDIEPPIEDKDLKLAFAHLWFFFDTDRNGELEPQDIRSKYYEMR